MDKTNLYLTRHGQTTWNVEHRVQGHLDSPLTDLGLEQASRLSEALSDVPFDVIYSSPSPRALRTAEIIRGNRCSNIIPHDSLREMHMGDWEGLRFDEIESTYPVQYQAFWHNPSLYKPVGKGESFFDVQSRVIPFVEKILSVHRGKNILIVTHTVTLKIIMSHFEKRPLDRFWDPPFIHPTSLCHVTFDGQVLSILKYGDISHCADML
jgi:broad specificity phosphatase PhoE